MNRTWVIFVLLELSAFAGCKRRELTPTPDGTAVTRIEIAGSSAMLPLVVETANEFMRRRAGVAIDVAAGGSRRGLESVAQGQIDIGTSDIDVEGSHPSELEDHRVAVTVFAVMANRGKFNERISSLSTREVKGIFTGAIRSWRELGGEEQPIIVINRRKGSGTRDTFSRVVLEGADFVPGTEEESSSLVRSLLEETRGAVSYLAISYRRDTVACFALNGVAPTNESVAAGKYPIWSYAHMFTRGSAQGVTKEFLDFVVSPTVQSTLVVRNGFLPIAVMNPSGNPGDGSGSRESP